MQKHISYPLLILLSFFQTEIAFSQANCITVDDNIECYRNCFKLDDKQGFKVVCDLEIVGTIGDGYLTFKDIFSTDQLIFIDSTCAYEPYFLSENEIRFVLKPENIRGKHSFSFSYYIQHSQSSKDHFYIEGTVMYLMGRRPQPLLRNIVSLPN